NIYKSRKKYQDYTKKSAGGVLKFGYPLFENVRGFVRYKNELVEITGLDHTVAEVIAKQEGFTRTSSAGLTIQRDVRNSRLDPTAGSLVYGDMEYAGGPFGGDNYYTKYRLNASKYINPWYDHTIIAHSRVSYAFGNNGHELPVYERYYLGGINSLRGFKYRSVGPKDKKTGDVIGGNKELLFNFEYLFYFKKEAHLKIVTFYDAGNAFDDGESINISELRHSAGYGIRWISPIGPLRLEWGHNIAPEPGEAKSDWEFTIGTFF
ncbi:outer membrane protein assembly factor, partial [Thermodesulfobacteriota bacterium]